MSGFHVWHSGTVIKGLSFTGFPGAGIYIDATNCEIKGCFIGLRPDGITARGNISGIEISQASSATQIGGKDPEQRNVISGNDFLGIGVHGNGTRIEGNYIGTGSDGVTALGNGFGIPAHDPASGTGIFIAASSTFVGEEITPTETTGAPNRIAFNKGNGIIIFDGQKNRIQHNEIFKNQGLGIDLSTSHEIWNFYPFGDYITLNDTNDSDTGPNNLQNFPILDHAFEYDNRLSIFGSFQGKPSSDFTFHFYLNQETDPSGFGEAQRYLGAFSKPTDSNGTLEFGNLEYYNGTQIKWEPELSFPINYSDECFVTATATDDEGNTSEFSPNVGILKSDLPPLLHPENFHNLDLLASVEEDSSNPAKVWSLPQGDWSRLNEGVLVNQTAAEDQGILEFNGWSLVDKDWWISRSDNQWESQSLEHQGREFFAGASGTIAVADPDEWFDGYIPDTPESPLPEYKSSLKSSKLWIQPDVPGNTAEIQFLSSWRPSGDQRGLVLVSFDSATPVEILRFDSNTPYMASKPIKQRFNHPKEAQEMEFYFRIEGARNDYWWAIDNVVATQVDLNASIGGRRIFIEPTSGKASETISMPLKLQGYGDEVAVGLSLQFDATRFTFRSLAAPPGINLLSNQSGIASGRLGLMLNYPGNPPLGTGEIELATLELEIKSTTPKGAYPVRIETTPSFPEVVDENASELQVNAWEDGMITVLNVPPQAVDDSATVNEHQVLTIKPADLAANDLDPDDSNLVATHSPAQGNDIPTQGTITINQAGDIEYFPGSPYLDLAIGQTRVDYIYYEVSDSAGATDRGKVTITVRGSEFEGDVTPSPHGDNKVDTTDLTQMGNLVVGLTSLQSSTTFWRADTAPRSNGGDGRLSVADFVQTGRYAAGLDGGLTTATGPTQQTP